MDKIMPQISMPEPVAPPPSPEEETVIIPDSGNKTDKDLIEKIQEDIMDEDYEDEEQLIEVTERIIPGEEEVFGDPPTPKIKPLEEAPAQGSSVEFKPAGKRPYKRKQPMSQKQKDHLERIRKIAAEKRAQQREEKAKLKIQKEEEKEEARVKKAEERILAKQRKKQQEQEEQQQQEVNKPKPKRAPTPQMGYSREDMEQAMFSAISSYETIRKREKENKKKQQLAQAREDQMKRTLQQAINPERPPDPWRQFFN
jgi:hypothetical protein